MRLAPIGGPLLGIPLDFSASENLSNNITTANTDLSTTNQATLGMVVEAAGTEYSTTSNVPNWGTCALVYARSTSSSAIRPGRLVTLDKDFTIADLANTANLGRPVYVTLTDFAAGNTIAQGGWVMKAGIAPVQYAVAATAGALYIGGAGQATPTAANGKQLNNAVCLIAASGSFTRTANCVNGSKVVRVSNVAGLYIGMAVSTAGNTPIPASSTIDKIAPDGLSITLNNAAVANGSATATFTHTNFGIVHFDRMFAQGQAV